LDVFLTSPKTDDTLFSAANGDSKTDQHEILVQKMGLFSAPRMHAAPRYENKNAPT
jgi:hypothetical protein